MTLLARMTKRTVHIPDDLDEQVVDASTVEDSYSGIVQDALREYLTERVEQEN